MFEAQSKILRQASSLGFKLKVHEVPLLLTASFKSSTSQIQRLGLLLEVPVKNEL